MVYKLYELSEDEIKIVEETFEKDYDACKNFFK